MGNCKPQTRVTFSVMSTIKPACSEAADMGGVADRAFIEINNSNQVEEDEQHAIDAHRLVEMTEAAALVNLAQ